MDPVDPRAPDRGSPSVDPDLKFEMAPITLPVPVQSAASHPAPAPPSASPTSSAPLPSELSSALSSLSSGNQPVVRLRSVPTSAPEVPRGPKAEVPPPPPPATPVTPAASTATAASGAPEISPSPPIPESVEQRVTASATTIVAAEAQRLQVVDAPQVPRLDGVDVTTSESGPHPIFADGPTVTSPGHRTAEVQTPDRIAMLPLRIVALAGVTTAFVLSGWQISRSIAEQPRLNSLAYGSMIAGVIGAFAVVVWTWVVTRNALSVLAPARTQELPRPSRAAMTWLAPMVFIAAAAGSVAYLSRRLNTPIEGTESSVPLMLAVAAMLIALPLMYSPVTYLSWVVRKVGGHGVTLVQWVWVPIALAAVGTAMVFGLRAGGAFGDHPDGLAPPWAVAVAAIIPATVVLLLGWRAAAGVETDIARAYDRRAGVSTSTSTRTGKFSSLYADDGPNHTALRDRGHIRQVPGGNMIGVLITAGLAGLAMTSVIGALVMFLFWQEARDGRLEAEQNDRAWELLALLQDVERTVAFIVLTIAAIWSFITITNVRMASARRRNPIIAGISWPVAAACIWIIGDRFVADGSVAEVIAGFAAQAAVLYVPFFLLERGADAVGTRRNPLRVTCVIGIILLVHVQGLGGLSTLSQTTVPAEVGRLAGYLTIGALVQLLAMFAATDANRTLADATQQVADQHNRLVEQRAAIINRTARARAAASARPDGSGADRVGATP